MTRHGASHLDGAAHAAAPSASDDTARLPGWVRLEPGSPRATRAGATASAPVQPSDAAAPVRRGVCSVPVMALASLGGFLVVLWVCTRSTRGQLWDERARLSAGSSARAWAITIDPLTYVGISGMAACLLALVVSALSRRRFAPAAAAVLVVGAANATTRLLKASWPARPHLWANSLPSGHTTVAMSLAAAALLVAPPGWRRWMVPFLGFVVSFVGCGTIVGRWHRPGDVVAAVLVTTFWAAVAIAAAHRAQRPPQRTRGRRDCRDSVRVVRGPAGGVVAGLVVVALGVRPWASDVDVPLAASSLALIALVTAVALAWIGAAADGELG